MVTLTPSQLTTLMADVALDATFGNAGYAHSADHAVDVAAAYNTVDATTWVWKTALLVKDIYEQQGNGGTTWDMTQYLAATAIQQGAWQAIGNTIVVNPSSPQLRAHVAAIFTGAGFANIRNHLLAIAIRNPTRMEKLFTVSGSGTTATPWVMGVEGLITPEQIFKGWKG